MAHTPHTTPSTTRTSKDELRRLGGHLRAVEGLRAHERRCAEPARREPHQEREEDRQAEDGPVSPEQRRGTRPG
eukprot:7670670-Heterocapsa_arctica.AAC.1